MAIAIRSIGSGASTRRVAAFGVKFEITPEGRRALDREPAYRAERVEPPEGFARVGVIDRRGRLVLVVDGDESLAESAAQVLSLWLEDETTQGARRDVDDTEEAAARDEPPPPDDNDCPWDVA